MTGLAVSVVLQTAIMATGAQPYSEAYEALVKEGKPMLVLVGADWCPACVTMKNTTLAKMERQGKLSDVSYVQLNSDRHQRLTSQIGSGGMIPQLVLYEKSETGFRRRQLTGAQSEGVIQSMISAAAQRRSNLASKIFKNASN